MGVRVGSKVGAGVWSRDGLVGGCMKLCGWR